MVHWVPQLIPAGTEVTVPLAVPVRLTLTVYIAAPKAAATDTLLSSVIAQVVALPAHAPLQPSNVEPASGAAVRITTVPRLKVAVQVLPQLMPSGLESTPPVPVPLLVSVSVARSGPLGASIGPPPPSTSGGATLPQPTIRREETNASE